MKLSVVIPAYNEEDNIKQAVLDVWKAYHAAEIIVVNDASTDKTASILRRVNVGNFINLKIITNKKNMGHGQSVLKGLRAATGDWILYIDADRQIEIHSIWPNGTRDFISGYRANRNDKLFRKITSFLLKMTILLKHGMYIKDANCPYKLYRRKALWSIIHEVPKSCIVPIACLEVLARKNGLTTAIIKTPHLPYQGIRQGFLQVPNKKFFLFAWKAFKEIISL